MTLTKTAADPMGRLREMFLSKVTETDGEVIDPDAISALVAEDLIALPQEERDAIYLAYLPGVGRQIMAQDRVARFAAARASRDAAERPQGPPASPRWDRVGELNESGVLDALITSMRGKVRLRDCTAEDLADAEQTSRDHAAANLNRARSYLRLRTALREHDVRTVGELDYHLVEAAFRG